MRDLKQPLNSAARVAQSCHDAHMDHAESEPHRKTRGSAVTSTFIVSLLVVDALLIGVHFIFVFGGVGDYFDMSLAASGSYSERVLQGKWLVLAVMIIALVALWRSWRPLPFAMLAIYFWVGDMTDLPVHLGRWFRSTVGGVFNEEQLLGIPTIEILSTSVHLVIFALFFGPALIAWRTAAARELRFMRSMSLAIIALGVFGIAFDVASASLLPQTLKNMFGDLIEDGGELVIGSFMLWIVAKELFRPVLAGVTSHPGQSPRASATA